MRSKNISLLTLIPVLLIFSAIFVAIANLINKESPKPNWMENLPVTLAPLQFDLTINNPDDNSLLFDKSLLISGKTSPDATVIISTDKDDSVVGISSTGEFYQNITLQPGLNSITISSFTPNGEEKQASRTVYYSVDNI